MELVGNFKSHGYNVRDVIIAHAISVDTQTNRRGKTYGTLMTSRLCTLRAVSWKKIHGRYVDQFQMSDDVNSLMQNHFLLGGVGNLNAVGKSRVIMFSR